jgi:non-ribosomal peptide synthetase component F
MSRLKGWSEVPRAQPLFESLLVFQNFPQDFSAEQQNGSSKRQDLSVALTLEETRNNYPLTLAIGPDPGSLTFLYDRHRFVGSDIDRMLNHIETLLSHFVENPDGKLSEFAHVLDDADRKAQLAKEINFKEARALKLKSIKRNGTGL